MGLGKCYRVGLLSAILVMGFAFIALGAESKEKAGEPTRKTRKATRARRVGKDRKILMVLTSVDKIPGTERETGFWAEEYIVPLRVFSDAGFRVIAASIPGGRTPVDPGSIDPAVVGEANAREFRLGLDELVQFKKTVKLATVEPKEFAAIFIAGGHGVMWDLTRSPEMESLIRKAVRAKVLVASLCHGPGALLGINLKDGWTFLQNKKVTGFSAAEEEMAGMSKTVPYCLEAELAKESGGKYLKADQPWLSHVVEDMDLILGQNPASSKATALAVVRKLEGRRYGR